MAQRAAQEQRVAAERQAQIQARQAERQRVAAECQAARRVQQEQRRRMCLAQQRLAIDQRPIRAAFRLARQALSQMPSPATARPTDPLADAAHAVPAHVRAVIAHVLQTMRPSWSLQRPARRRRSPR